MTTVVFSGSGVLFPAHLGAAEYLFSSGKVRKHDRHLIGTSGGALVASILATGMSPRDAKNIAAELLPKDVVVPNTKLISLPCTRSALDLGLFSLSKMEKILRKYTPPQFMFAQSRLTVVTHNLNTRMPHYFSDGLTPMQNVAQAARASAAVPFLFDPVKIGDSLHYDGGVTKNFAVDLEPGAETIGIKIGGTPKGKWREIKTPLDLVISLLESMLEYQVVESIEDNPSLKVVEVPLPYGPFDIFGIEKQHIEDMFERGFYLTKAALK